MDSRHVFGQQVDEILVPRYNTKEQTNNGRLSIIEFFENWYHDHTVRMIVSIVIAVLGNGTVNVVVVVDFVVVFSEL